MFLFGKSKKNESSLRSGIVEKVKSRMIAIPYDDGDIADPKVVFDRFKDTDEIKIKSTEPNIFEAYVVYKETEYKIEVGNLDINVTPDDPALNVLRESERQVILKAKHGLCVDMIFSDNNMDSFHLQIKLLNMLVPNMAVLIDCDSYRMHSGRWAVMTAESSVPPSPEYMFVLHCVNERESGSSVWIHTHGLNRCGTIELEILGTTVENYEDFGHALNQIVHRLIGDNKFIDEKEPFVIGVSQGNEDIVVTWQRSEWSLKDFPKNILGGPDDRDDEHSINMGVIYVYAREKDIINGKLTSVLKYEKQLTDNPIFYKSTEETRRMRALALERVEYIKKLKDAFDESTVLIKIGLKPDAEYEFDPEYNEYIWFEANELGDDMFKATLTQDAYYVKGMTEGVQGEFAYSEVVDWRVYTKEKVFSPDNIYLFEFK